MTVEPGAALLVVHAFPRAILILALLFEGLVGSSAGPRFLERVLAVGAVEM
jgi:hypothetical protein